ncbi:unnamed protein product, partial [Vitis vinifera]
MYHTIATGVDISERKSNIPVPSLSPATNFQKMSLIPSFFGGRRNNMFDLKRKRMTSEGCHGEWCSYCYCSQGRGQQTRCQGHRYFWLRITYMHLNLYKNDETAGVAVSFEGCFLFTVWFFVWISAMSVSSYAFLIFFQHFIIFYIFNLSLFIK